MRKAVKIFAAILMIILVLQTAVLCIFAIQFSDSMVFRITVGFLGIGLIITPLVLKTLGRIAVEVSPREEWTGFFYLVYMLASPWIHLPSHGNVRLLEYFNVYAVSSASIQLATSSLGFFVTGIIASVKSGPDASTGEVPGPAMRALRVLISLGLLVFAAYSSLPVLCRLFPVLFSYNPFSMAQGSYGILVATSAGDPVLWLVNLLLGAYVYFKFYSDWILKDRI
ncbi:MAG TPA: hypothetical protein PK514_05405 [Spirochaetota bacterium]|nr:hypothetical protein [Spirochaetota bacterium]